MRGLLRIVLMVVGVLALLMGLLWVGQGTGIIRWPADSFMIDVSAWTIRGLILALAGAAVILISRRV
ncbi:MAG: hypothetical protein H7X93_05515 [Sphingomonadaceae bacterium]|nr:hypothetical protein [Sphingomonadaceae bacterium]